MAYVQTHASLHLAHWSEAHQRERNSPYRFTVTAYGGTPHTAFRTRAALEQWLEARGLVVSGGVPDAGGSARIEGTYRTALHMSYDEFYSQQGPRFRALQNGEYTMAIVSSDPDGLRTEHKLNPNCRDRPRFDYRDSEALIDAGRAELAPPRAW